MKIALLQMTSGINPLRNTEVMVAAARDAAMGGAVMLFTPEMSGLLDRDRSRSRSAIRQEADDLVLAAMRNASREQGIWVNIGSLAIEPGRPDGRLANRSFVINDCGEIVARYDKVHLFDVDLPTGESWRESGAYAGGNRSVSVQTPLGSLGLSVCYDLRFPQLYQGLSEAGATLLSIPAAFTVPTGEAHWHVLMRARAIENAAFVIASAQTGVHEDGRATFGHSLVVSPWGDVLLDMGTEPGLGFCELNLGLIDEVRARIPVIAHRRRVSVA